jgi:hypothetical protein
MDGQKARENRLRRVAARQGLRLVKSRRRDPQAADYGTFVLIDRNNVVAVGSEGADAPSLSLDDVENYLTGAERHDDAYRIARARAAQHGTSVEQELAFAAEWVARGEQAPETRRREWPEKAGGRYVEMENHLASAQCVLVDGLKIAQEPREDWDDDERESLTSTVSNVRALLDLIDGALVGAADIDWDAELAKIGQRPSDERT